MSEDGWDQIRAGLSLITWSKLAYWNSPALRLRVANENEFEGAQGKESHKAVHDKFGRLICWISFGVGGEYLVKGVAMLTGDYPKPSTKKNMVIRPPMPGHIDEWAKLVTGGKPPEDEEEGVYLGSLGRQKIKKLPWDKMCPDEGDRERTKASMILLTDTIRNRDAHRYAANVRRFNFRLVKDLFVPAFNVFLVSLDQSELSKRSP
jgi:hypothetical protein